MKERQAASSETSSAAVMTSLVAIYFVIRWMVGETSVRMSEVPNLDSWIAVARPMPDEDDFAFE
jgi:hypothetical protein